MFLASLLLAAQTQPSPPLIQDPQQGATPRPVLPVPTAPPPLPVPVVEPARPAPGVPLGSPLVSRPLPAGPNTRLPTAVGDPMRIDPATDPVLQLTRAEAPAGQFRSVVARAVTRNPNLDEARAQADEAEAVRNEARVREYPVADLSLSNFSILARRFSDDQRNILERSRPQGRTDATLRAQLPIFDFGATGNRIEAGNLRITAAAAQIEDTATQIALRAVGTWYNVYAYRALVRLGEAFAGSQRELRARQQERIEQGYAAPGDLAQVDGYIAASDAQLADFRRAAANAEAQYLAILGEAPPADLGRAPVAALDGTDRDLADLPAVRAARASADAARRDVGAAKSDMLPTLSAGLDAGRYGVFETAGDYDIRGNVTMSLRIGGPGAQRVDQAQARADGAEARFRRIRDDAARDASVARSDLDALEEARGALEANYLASRRSRDVLAERFRVSRGTLVDVLAAESNYFSVAARYIQTVTELDTARYVLLARTGALLPALAIAPDTLGTPR